jgi:hypothetical protein
MDSVFSKFHSTVAVSVKQQQSDCQTEILEFLLKVGLKLLLINATLLLTKMARKLCLLMTRRMIFLMSLLLSSLQASATGLCWLHTVTLMMQNGTICRSQTTNLQRKLTERKPKSIWLWLESLDLLIL